MSNVTSTGIATRNLSIKSHLAPKLLHPGWKHSEICFTRVPKANHMHEAILLAFVSSTMSNHWPKDSNTKNNIMLSIANMMWLHSTIASEMIEFFQLVLFQWPPHVSGDLRGFNQNLEREPKAQSGTDDTKQSMQNGLQAIVPTCTKYRYICGISGHSHGLSPNKDSVSKKCSHNTRGQLHCEISCTDPTHSWKYWNTTCSTACNHHSCKTTVRHTRASRKKDVLKIRILTPSLNVYTKMSIAYVQYIIITELCNLVFLHLLSNCQEQASRCCTRMLVYPFNNPATFNDKLAQWAVLGLDTHWVPCG